MRREAWVVVRSNCEKSRVKRVLLNFIVTERRLGKGYFKLWERMKLELGICDIKVNE